MRIFHSTKNALEKELAKLYKEEARYRSQTQNRHPLVWGKKLEEKIPQKARNGIHKGFQIAFELTFEKGNFIIEKTYNKETREKDFKILDYAVNVKGGHRPLSALNKESQLSHAANIAVTSATGIGLGVLGIGLPDIVLWVGMLLRGVYETALGYGFDYESPEEKYFILKLLETSMLTGKNWAKANREIDNAISKETLIVPDSQTLSAQMEKTSNAFATDVMVAKFIQGLPIVGVVGGALNPIYYNRVMKYVQLKYRKRYLLKKLRSQ